MTISINHLTYVITIPKSDTLYVTTNATTGYEIRSYDEYALMRELSDYLDSEVGQVLPNAFTHATQVVISGITYARSISFLAPYTITFENGAYQVNLVGGTNNNLLDVLNPNNVSVIPANSAGLQTVATGSGVTAQDKSDIIGGVWTYLIEAGFSAEEIIRILASVAAGNATGLEGTTPVFRDLANTKNRIEATYNEGTRTITTKDAT